MNEMLKMIGKLNRDPAYHPYAITCIEY